MQSKNKLFHFFEEERVGEVVQIQTDLISPSPYQPRLHFDEAALKELAQSIQENGLIQPISVRQSENGYEIIAGERRYRACKYLDMKEIPCYILSPNEKEAAEMALVENIQREDLSAIEEAKSYLAIMRQSQITQQEVAKRVGKSQSAVANKIRLLNLPEEIQQGVVEASITERHARALLKLPQEKQKDVYQTILEKKYTVKETEEYIEKISEPKPRKRRPMNKGFTRNVQIGINSVNECVEMIKRMGIDVDVEMKQQDGKVEMIIRFE